MNGEGDKAKNTYRDFLFSKARRETDLPRQEYHKDKPVLPPVE